LLAEARRQSARSVNAILTATYWEIGRRIVEFVQRGETRAEYGDEVLERLSSDLTKRFGRGSPGQTFSKCGSLCFQSTEKDCQTLSGKSWVTAIGGQILQTCLKNYHWSENARHRLANLPTTNSADTRHAKLEFADSVPQNLPGRKIWYQTSSETIFERADSADTVSEFQIFPDAVWKICRTNSARVAEIFEVDLALYLEALLPRLSAPHGRTTSPVSWSSPRLGSFTRLNVCAAAGACGKLDRQVSTLFYERTALAKNKASCSHGREGAAQDAVSVEEEIKSPYVRNFSICAMTTRKAIWRTARPPPRSVC